MSVCDHERCRLLRLGSGGGDDYCLEDLMSATPTDKEVQRAGEEIHKVYGLGGTKPVVCFDDACLPKRLYYGFCPDHDRPLPHEVTP